MAEPPYLPSDLYPEPPPVRTGPWERPKRTETESERVRRMRIAEETERDFAAARRRRGRWRIVGVAT